MATKLSYTRIITYSSLIWMLYVSILDLLLSVNILRKLTDMRAFKHIKIDIVYRHTWRLVVGSISANFAMVLLWPIAYVFTRDFDHLNTAVVAFSIVHWTLGILYLHNIGIHFHVAN